MKKRSKKIRQLSVAGNICKVFCAAHVAAGMFMLVMLDSPNAWLPALLALVYCLIAALILGLLSVECEYEIEYLRHGDDPAGWEQTV